MRVTRTRGGRSAAVFVLAVAFATVLALVPDPVTTARAPEAYVPIGAARFSPVLARELLATAEGAPSPQSAAAAPGSNGPPGELAPATVSVATGTTAPPPFAPLGAQTPLPFFGPAVPAPGPLAETGHIGQIVNLWRWDPDISWYGPGMYGELTACGVILTTTVIGVAHRTLPCGTLVQFRWNGITVNARVIDRGPYVAGRTWDMTAGLCAALRHCWTGPISYRIP